MLRANGKSVKHRYVDFVVSEKLSSGQVGYRFQILILGYMFVTLTTTTTVSFYRPQTKLRKGNVFTPVCQSFCSWGGLSQCMLGYTPLGRPPLGRHPQQKATAADGTHHTGMHSCFITSCSLLLLKFQHFIQVRMSAGTESVPSHQTFGTPGGATLPRPSLSSDIYTLVQGLQQAIW